MDRAYDQLAPWYDRLRRVQPGELEYWSGLASRSPGPVLELGCGTGIVLASLAAARPAGETWGIDQSPAMLQRARDRLEGLGLVAHLALADMRDFAMPRCFGLIAVPYRTFQHLETEGDQLACLARVRTHLEPDGRLALEIAGADPEGVQGGAIHVERREPLGGGRDVDPLVSELVVELDPDTGLARQTRTILRGEVILARATTVVRYLRAGEMERLMMRAGFEVVERLGGFDQSSAPRGAEGRWLARPGG